jgi:DNA-binding response OmpR family regulator
MYEVLVYLTDRDYQDEISDLFNQDNFEVTVSHNINEAIEVVSEELLDLVMIWPADTKNIESFINALKSNELEYLPVLAVIVDKDQVEKISSLPVTDYILLPAPREEFYAVIREIIESIDVQTTVMEGMHWQGSLEEYNVIDLFQMVSDDHNDAELVLTCTNRNANIYFKEGKIIHAELMGFEGEAALHKISFWSKGIFQIKFNRLYSVENTIQSTNQEILLILAHELSEFDQVYRGLPHLFNELMANPFKQVTDISSLQKKILNKCKLPISIFSLLLEFDEENKVIIQEIKELFDKNYIGRKNEIESLIVEEERKKGFNKIVNAISSVFKKKTDFETLEQTEVIQNFEERFEKISFEQLQLEEKDKNSIIEKIESLN